MNCTCLHAARFHTASAGACHLCSCQKANVKTHQKAYYQRPEVKTHQKAYKKAYYQRRKMLKED